MDNFVILSGAKNPSISLLLFTVAGASATAVYHFRNNLPLTDANLLERYKRMIAQSPEHAIELLDRAFNEGDLETILGIYDDSAVVIPEPGTEARGVGELRALYQRFMKPGTSATQLKTHVVEADGVALFTSRWTLSVEGAPPETFIATTVFRKQPDGGWKALIDNARGPLVLGPE